MRYLSASTLGISSRERDSLASVRELLNSGEVRFEPNPMQGLTTPKGFNLGPYQTRGPQGEVCACVSGWANELTGEFTLERMGQIQGRLLRHDMGIVPLAMLFHGHPWWEVARPEHGVNAIDTYLGTGQIVDWTSIIQMKDVTPRRELLPA